MCDRISHHIPEDMLLDYASGSLSEAWSLGVATHLAFCPSCRERFNEAEAVGGGLIAEAVPAELPEDAFDLMLMKMDEDPQQEPVPSQEPISPSLVPEPLRSYLGGDLHTLKWRNFGIGVSQIRIPTKDGLSARLLKVSAGQPVPEHGHRGRELTLVLTGSFSTHQGTFERGDIEIADSDVDHQPIAGLEEDCICLAVTDAPLRFQGWAARLIQPFLGI